MMKIVVVGYGMAAARFASQMRNADVSMTILGEERHPAYNRSLLADVLGGHYRPEAITLPAPGPGVDVCLGVPVISIDRANQTVHMANGDEHHYDKLVIATGSRPILPPFRGLYDQEGRPKSGVFAFRTLDDYTNLAAAVKNTKRAVVIGGGVLGIAAAQALASCDVLVEIVHAGRHPMDRYLNGEAGGVLKTTLARLGIDVYAKNRVKAILGDQTVAGVKLDTGFVLDCDMVVLACGVAPRVELAKQAGLQIGRNKGIVIGDDLASVTDDRIHAIGECAEHAGRSFGLVAPAWEQADVLAERLSGRDPTALYHGSSFVMRLTTGEVDVAVVGDSLTTTDTGVIRVLNEAAGSYKMVAVRDNRVVAGIFVGDLDTIGTVTLAHTRQELLDADKLHLVTTSQ
jgi:assimilatory nitrate reductase electron transfer subunit